MKELFMMICFASLIGSMGGGGCSSAAHLDGGDRLARQLNVGLSKSEIIAILGEPGNSGSFDLPGDYKIFSVQESEPYNLLQMLQEGAEWWSYPYWVSSNTRYRVRIYFDDNGYVIGWLKPHNKYSLEKYLNEKIISKLNVYPDRNRALSKSQIHELFGPPDEFVEIPKEPTRSLYVDHFWLFDPFGGQSSSPPGRVLEVYSYKLDNGSERKVFISINPETEKVGNVGYDHAHIEAERYLQEKSKK